MLPESLLGLSNGPNMQSMGESTGEKENRHQAEEPAESHRSLTLWMKGHLLVCVWDQILGSKCHPYASKHDQRHFRGTKHGIKDMFCLLSVFLCMFLEHGGHSGVKTTWGGPCVSPLVMWRHAFQVTRLCKGTSNHSFTPQRWPRHRDWNTKNVPRRSPAVPSRPPATVCSHRYPVWFQNSVRRSAWSQTCLPGQKPHKAENPNV